jgi:hypothetical protein
MKNLHCLALVLIITGGGIFFSSCIDKAVSPNGAPGSIHGKVILYDTLSDPFTANGAARIYDASGVQVTVEGTSYSTMTDSLGKWEIDNIPSGTYPSIVFSKAGFGKQEAKNIGSYGSNAGFSVVSNGDEFVNMDLYRISLISCDLVLRSFYDYTKITHHDTLLYENGYLNDSTIYDSLLIPNGAATLSSRVLDQIPAEYFIILLYFGASPAAIDPLDGKSFLYTSYADVYPVKSLIGNVLIEKDALIDAGFKPGQTIYCVAYCAGKLSFNSGYVDMATGMTIQSGLSPNHSEVKSFILPP